MLVVYSSLGRRNAELPWDKGATQQLTGISRAKSATQAGRGQRQEGGLFMFALKIFPSSY